MLDEGNDGIAIGKKLRKAGNTALFVLVTSRSDRALDGYEANVLRFLVKPVDKDMVFAVPDAVVKSLELDRKVLAVKFKYETSYISVKDIIYVESYMRKRYIFTKTNKYETTATLQELIEQLADFQYFFSPRQTHLINLSHVVSQSKSKVVMTNGSEVKFEKGRYEQFVVEFLKYLSP